LPAETAELRKTPRGRAAGRIGAIEVLQKRKLQVDMSWTNPPSVRRRVARSALCVAAIVAMAIYASPSRAGITFDASAVANSNTTEMTWQHTVGPGLDRAMVVGVSIFSANKSVSGITYAGAPFTFVGAQDGGSGANNRRMEIWVLTAPAVGTNDVVLTMTGGSKQVAGSASYFGVDQLSPTSAFTSAQGSSSAASVAVASAADRMVVDCISTKGRAVSLTAGAGQTELWNDVTRTNGGNAMGAGSHTAGSGTTTMTWSLGKSEYWVIGATSLMPAPPRPYLPDAMVKLDTEPDAAYRYDAIYEATASWQVASNGGINGTPFTYPIRFENDGFNADQFLITGTGGDTAFAVQYLDGAQSARQFGPLQLPADQYFMMGDNRDHSKDSRYIDSIPEQYLVGEAVRIWLHFVPWQTPDWARIGTKIQ